MEQSSGSVNAWIVRLFFMFAQFVCLFLQSDFLIWCPGHLLLLFFPPRFSDSPPSCCCTAVWCSPCSSLGNEREMALLSQYSRCCGRRVTGRSAPFQTLGHCRDDDRSHALAGASCPNGKRHVTIVDGEFRGNAAPGTVNSPAKRTAGTL